MVEDEILPPQYSEIELAYRSHVIKLMEGARSQREQQHPEFDEQTYSQYWESNAKAANSYIPPKVNEQDVRTTTGTTREKSNTILSAVLNYNLEPDVEAFDKSDMEVHKLGTIMEDLIKKSRKLEVPDYDVKKIVMYHELFSQGTLVVEDVNLEFKIPQKEADILDIEKGMENLWKERMDKVYKFCSSEIISGLNVYFGNIREFYLELQPYIVIRKVKSRAVAQSLYGSWPRWKNVPKQFMVRDNENVDYHNWSLEPMKDNMVEEIKFYDKWNNNFMIMLNGVLMFPVKMHKGRFSTFPLSALTGECEYPLAKGDIEPISRFFAYSKSFPAKMKVDQQIYDEMLKAIVLKTRKSYQPPMANNTGKTLSKKIFYPGTIHNGINPDKLQEIGKNEGVTNSEFGAAQFIKQIIDEKSVSGIMEGQAQAGRQTAREIIELKQQSMLKMGLAIFGVINLEKRLCQLRLRNILRYWTEPIDKNVELAKDGIKRNNENYRTVTVDAEFEDGTSGKRMIDMTTKAFPHPEQIMAEEKLMGQMMGKKVEKIYLNPKELKSVDYYWHIEVVPTEKNTSALKAASFDEFVQKIMSLFIPLGKMPNLDYLAERMSILQGEDPNRLFPQMQPQQNPMMQQGGGQPGQAPFSPLQQQMSTGQSQTTPSLNQLLAVES